MDIEKLTQVAARAARDALNADGTFDVRSPDECSLDDQEQGEWDATVRATSAVLAIALAALERDALAEQQFGRTAIFLDELIENYRTLATQLGAANG